MNEHEDYEVKHWTMESGVSEDMPRALVKRAGVMVRDVRAAFHDS
ncbi:DUF3606 domain-containing protein [Bacillus sp. NP157]|nr:DUF3606 domain-containing protein [Bacillus sp. NP157]